MSAIDYRALLVRYMASIIEVEGISLIGHADEIEFTPAEMEALREIELEASQALGDDPLVLAAAIVPRFTIWLRGELVRDVLSFEYQERKSGPISWVERYARDEAGNIKSLNGEFVTEIVKDDFEVRWDDMIEVQASATLPESDIVKVVK